MTKLEKKYVKIVSDKLYEVFTIGVDTASTHNCVGKKDIDEYVDVLVEPLKETLDYLMKLTMQNNQSTHPFIKKGADDFLNKFFDWLKGQMQDQKLVMVNDKIITRVSYDKLDASTLNESVFFNMDISQIKKAWKNDVNETMN